MVLDSTKMQKYTKVHVDESEPTGVDESPFEKRDVHVKTSRWVTQDYDITDLLLGRGKFGEVKKCREKRTGRNLAAKFIEIEGPQERKDVMNEFDIMKSLQHPRLLQLYDAFENKNKFCLVTELISGGELFERVINDDFILTEKACVMFMRQICEGVEFMHARNVLHLDMKPENILCLTREGNRIKIIDFGLARAFTPKDELRILFGTPEFMAPEVVNYDPVSPATDMWSVGVICYVLLSGLSPFMGEAEAETLVNVTYAKWDFTAEEFESISMDAKDFITHLLVKDPKKRMSSKECMEHRWLRRSVKREATVERSLSKKRLRKFVFRRKWQRILTILCCLATDVWVFGLSHTFTGLGRYLVFLRYYATRLHTDDRDSVCEEWEPLTSQKSDHSSYSAL
ncbi:myosin light chain kinase family member 4-like isoform X2 [Argopecten irradians]